MPAKTPKPRKAARKKAAKRSSAKTRAKPTAQADEIGVRKWIAATKPEHRAIVERVDQILRKAIPEVVPTIKFRKPSQPLGVPFYGRPGHGWVAAVWSFKSRVTVGFFGGIALDPMPPRAQGARTRLVDYASLDDLDETQLRRWAKQAAEVQGWARV